MVPVNYAMMTGDIYSISVNQSIIYYNLLYIIYDTFTYTNF